MGWAAEPAGRFDPAPTCRWSPGDYAALEKAAALAGVKVPRLVRETAVRYGPVVAGEIRAEKAAAGPAGGKDEAPPAPAAAVNVDRMLAQRSGLPVSSAKRMRLAGRVAIAGEVWSGDVVPAARLAEGLALDGEPV